jgi:Kip1 ubiquitination-promoting complex protein 1
VFQSGLYGNKWYTGDVVGCMLDLDTQQLSFSQNGEFLGVALENFRLRLDDGNFAPYSPGLTLHSLGEQKCTLNFGSKPFMLNFQIENLTVKVSTAWI